MPSCLHHVLSHWKFKIYHVLYKPTSHRCRLLHTLFTCTLSHLLPPRGFGFSVGDFISGLELIRQFIKALEDSSGSSKEYRDLIRELYTLERALLEVKHLNVDESLQPQKIATIQTVVQCQETISSFLLQIATYQPSLRSGGSGKGWLDCLRKIQWAVYGKEDVQRFRAQIQGYTSSITILLVTFYKAASGSNPRGPFLSSNFP